MKKIIFFVTMLFVMAACSKDEIMARMESMAGQWYCTIDAVDDSGNPNDADARRLAQ